jgi:hypothetical protein
MEDTSGFYLYDEVQEMWYYGPNAVYNINYQLYRELKDTYTYPVDGWSWYDESPERYKIWLLKQNDNNI